MTFFSSVINMSMTRTLTTQKQRTRLCKRHFFCLLLALTASGDAEISNGPLTSCAHSGYLLSIILSIRIV